MRYKFKKTPTLLIKSSIIVFNRLLRKIDVSRFCCSSISLDGMTAIRKKHSALKSMCQLIILFSYEKTTQPETPQACCKLLILLACCKLSTSCSRPDEDSGCNNPVKFSLDATWCLQTCCKLLNQLAASLFISSLTSLIQQLAANLLNASSLMQVVKGNLAAN